MVILAVLSCIINVSMALVVGVIRNELSNSFCLTYDMTNERDAFALSLILYLRASVNFVIPFLIISILSLGTVWTLRRARRERERLGIANNNHSEDRSIIFLLLVSFSFLLFTLPEGVSPLLVTFVILDGNVAALFNSCALILILFRSGGNLAMYFFAGSQFRKTLYSNFRILGVWISEKLSKSSSSTQSATLPSQ